MKPSKMLVTLSLVVALLSLIQSGIGLFWQDQGHPFPFTTLHGAIIQMYGQGIYRNDPYFNGPILRGTDAITLFVAVPLLILAVVLYWRGSLRGRILLGSVLFYFLYNATSMGFGVAYNHLFPVYLASFSTSLFAFILAFQSVNLLTLMDHVKTGLPHRGMAILLFVSSAGLCFAWLPDLLTAFFKGSVPAIASYTTEVTYLLDLGIIIPACIIAGVALLRRQPLGYLLGANLMVMLILMGLVVTAQSIAQSLAGIQLTTGEFIGKAGSFMLLALIAMGLVVKYFISMKET